MKTLLRHLALLTLIVTPLLASFENTQRSLLPAKTNTLAPRNGVAFDGTSGTRISSTLTNQNLGTDSFSVSMTIEVPSTNPSTSRGLWYLASSNTTNNVTNAAFAEMKTAGEIVVYITGAASSGDVRTVTVSGFRAAYSGKRVSLTFVRDSSASTMTVYANGVALSGTGGTVGTPPAWSGSVTSTYFVLGNNASAGEVWDRAILSASLYNLALSASDVVEVYENGGAVPFRYQFGSQRVLNNTTMSGTGTMTGVTVTATQITGTFTAYTEIKPQDAGANITFFVGKTYRIKASTASVSGGLVLTGGTGPFGQIDITQFAGSGQVLTAVPYSSPLFFWPYTATGINIQGLDIKQLGAIVHFPFDEGAGLTAYDQSTNALNATLTATGVSWAQPNRALVTGGNLTVSGTGTSSFAGSLLQRSSTGVGAIASIGTDTGSYSVLRVQNTAVSGRSFDIGTAGSGDATLGSKLYIYDNTAGAARWTMDSSGNIAQTGNLTVSGTGQSNFSGKVYAPNLYAGTSSGSDYSAGTVVISVGSDTFPALAFGGANYGWGFLERLTDGDFVLGRRNGSTTNTAVLTLGRATGNATLAGNLTVSGTGTSSFAGPLNVTASSLGTFTSSTANATSGEQAFTIKGSNNSTSTNFGSNRAPSLVLWNNSGAANSYAALVFQDGGGNAVAGVQGLFIDDATNHGALTFWSRAASGSYAEAGRFTGGGNLLIGTTVDSSGLLQVGTNTTTAAGGMKFGTDVSVYRSGTRELTFLAASTPTFVFAGTALGSTTTIKLGDGTNNDQGIIESQGGALVFKRNAFTALTLDSSQNATFAKDILLGTSGPSVNSTLSARAPRQGLVFDSSAHGGAPIANQPAFGTSDFTVTAWVNPVAVASNVYILASVADSASLFFTANTVQWIANSSAVISVAGGVVAGKSQLFVVTRSAGTTTYYYNGVAVSTTSSGSGNLANPIVKMGSSASGASGHFNGTISALIYNRALSASEVVSLYEAGAPAGSDYNSASNTSIVTSAFVNGNSGGAYLYDTYSGASATGFTAVKTQTTTEADAYSGNTFSVVKGQQFLVTFTCTLTSGTLPELYLSDWAGSPLYNIASRITAGSFSRVITATQSGSGVRLRFYNPMADQVNYSISNLSITRLGLLLAPDAAQAGGGLTWYDTSGNAANITLPTSGVSWNVPSSRVLGGNWTTSGNLTVSGTGTSSFAGSVSIAKVLPTDFGAFSVYNDLGSSATKLEAGVSGSGRGGTYFGQSEANSSIIFSNGTSSNGLLIGSFNAKQVVIGTNNTAAISINGTTQATTLAGNLTVSGTGTSSFASGSKLGVGTTSPGVTFVAAGAPATLNYTIGQTSLADIRSTSAATTNDGPSLTFSGYYQTSLNTSTYGAIKGVLLGAGDGNSAAGALAFLTANTGGVLSEQARLTNLGNFIIGSPFTDAGYKLQVNGSAIIAGPIVSNSATDQKMSFVAAANATYGGANYLRWYRADGTTTRAFFGFGSGNSQVFNLGTEESGDSLQFSTGTNTTALTLDSSQRAQFAGTTDSSSTTTGALTVAGGVGIAKKLYVGDSITITGSNAALFFNSRTGANSNYAWYSPDGTVARLYDNTNAKTLVEFAANTGDATFAGSIRQNQANNISLTSGVATTIFSLGTSAGVYIVTATLDVNAVAGYAIVGKGPTGSWQVLANSGTQISFSMSTNDLQITQSSGATSTTNTFNLLRLR